MSLDSITKAVANEAWSQLVQSILSDSPPSDMDADYYYTFPETGFHYLQKQLNRLEIYTYKLGSENIQARMRSAGMHLQVLRENEQGTEHCSRSDKYSEVMQPKEDENHQAMEPIQDCNKRVYYKTFPEISIHHLQQNMKFLHIDQCQQGMEYIQNSKRSTPYYNVLKARKYRNQQGIEYIQNCKRSTPDCSVVKTRGYGYKQGIEHIRCGSRSRVLYENMRANVLENQQGIEHIRYGTRSTPFSNPLQANNMIHQGIEFIRESKKSTALSMFENHENYGSRIDNIDIRRSTRSPEVLQSIERAKQRCINYIKAERMSYSFDKLLEYVKNGGLQDSGEIPTLRYDVLKVIKLLHHYGLDIIRIGVEEELECVNQMYRDRKKDLEMQYKKKGLEVMLRICNFETCQKIIYEILCKAEGDQVFYEVLW